MFKSKTHYSVCIRVFKHFENKPPYIIPMPVGKWALHYASFELWEVFGKAFFALNVTVLKGE